MKTLTATELRGNVYRILDEILASGVPVEIEKTAGVCGSLLWSLSIG